MNSLYQLNSGLTIDLSTIVAVGVIAVERNPWFYIYFKGNELRIRGTHTQLAGERNKLISAWKKYKDSKRKKKTVIPELIMKQAEEYNLDKETIRPNRHRCKPTIYGNGFLDTPLGQIYLMFEEGN